MPKGYPTKPYTVEGVPMTPNAARLTIGNKTPDKPSYHAGRNYRVVQMKDELNKMMDLVKHSREQLTAQLKDSYTDSVGLEVKYLKALAELTRMFDNLTRSRIQLDKAERQLEREMSATDERRAALEHIMSLDPSDRGQAIKDLVQQHNALIKQTWYKMLPEDVITPEPEALEEPETEVEAEVEVGEGEDGFGYPDSNS